MSHRPETKRRRLIVTSRELVEAATSVTAEAAEVRMATDRLGPMSYSP